MSLSSRHLLLKQQTLQPSNSVSCSENGIDLSDETKVKNSDTALENISQHVDGKLEKFPASQDREQDLFSSLTERVEDPALSDHTNIVNSLALHSNSKLDFCVNTVSYKETASVCSSTNNPTEVSVTDLMTFDDPTSDTSTITAHVENNSELLRATVEFDKSDGPMTEIDDKNSTMPVNPKSQLLEVNGTRTSPTNGPLASNSLRDVAPIAKSLDSASAIGLTSEDMHKVIVHVSGEHANDNSLYVTNVSVTSSNVSPDRITDNSVSPNTSLHRQTSSFDQEHSKEFSLNQTLHSDTNSSDNSISTENRGCKPEFEKLLSSTPVDPKLNSKPDMSSFVSNTLESSIHEAKLSNYSTDDTQLTQNDIREKIKRAVYSRFSSKETNMANTDDGDLENTFSVTSYDLDPHELNVNEHPSDYMSSSIVITKDHNAVIDLDMLSLLSEECVDSSDDELSGKRLGSHHQPALPYMDVLPPSSGATVDTGNISGLPNNLVDNFSAKIRRPDHLDSSMSEEFYSVRGSQSEQTWQTANDFDTTFGSPFSSRASLYSDEGVHIDLYIHSIFPSRFLPSYKLQRPHLKIGLRCVPPMSIILVLLF